MQLLARLPFSSMKDLVNVLTKYFFQVFDSLVNQVPTHNVAILLNSFSTQLGLKFSDVPQRLTVEAMTQELGAITELQTAEYILKSEVCALGFDANNPARDSPK